MTPRPARPAAWPPLWRRLCFYSETTALYTNGLGSPIYFKGTDPHNPGVPNSPPVVGTPREQFEEGLTVQEWHAYMDVIGQYNM